MKNNNKNLIQSPFYCIVYNMITFAFLFFSLFCSKLQNFKLFKDNSSGDVPHRRMLRRETAVELPITPSKSASVAGTSVEIDNSGAAGGGNSGTTSAGAPGISNINERSLDSPSLSRNLSADRTYGRTLSAGASAAAQNYLIPSSSEPSQPRFRKSIESLPKNSSSDTEYSLQPYRVIKQSSNDTNTSLTGSFNIDQSFGGHELSLDANETSAHYTTVIENVDRASFSSDTASLHRSGSNSGGTGTASSSTDQPPQSTQPSPQPPITTTTTTKPAKITTITRQQSDLGASRSLRKQFSVDHSLKTDTTSSTIATTAAAITNLKLPTISTIPATPTKTLSAIVSSSTSTDESKDERDIPTISTNYVTNVVQDEIAKLSSNISRNTDGRDGNGGNGSAGGAPGAGGGGGGGCSTDQTVNETMC